MKQRDIQQIIETYELPSKLEERILVIALRRVEEGSIGDFTTTYREIADLIEAFRTPRQEKYAVRLDSAQRNDNERTFHEMIGNIDPKLDSVSEDAASVPADILPQKIVDQLEEKVDEMTLRKMKEVFGDYMNFDLGLAPEDIVQSKSIIEARVQQLFERFNVDGKIKIPRRPIKRVTFEPELRIEFGKRRFDGNPLAFFQENSEVYAGMSKSQLQTFDPSLYMKLLGTGKLNEAIPEDKRFSKHDGGTGKYRGYKSPLEYLRAHRKELEGLSRRDLSKVDQGLYFGLKDTGMLDEAMVILGSEEPAGFFDGYPSAKDYYLAHPELAQLTRTQLRRKNWKLVQTLEEEGEWENLIPSKMQNRFKKTRRKRRRSNGHSCHLEIFLENYNQLEGIGRAKLAKLSWGLYRGLLRDGDLDLAIPKGRIEPNLDAIKLRIAQRREEKKLKEESKSSLDNKVVRSYRGYDSPLAYLRAHPEVYGKFKGRGELSRVDQGLYNSLRKWRQLDDAFPKLRERAWRGFKSSYDYFVGHQEEFRGIGLEELRRRDAQLARVLYRNGYLDDALKILDDDQKNKESAAQRIDKYNPNAQTAALFTEITGVVLKPEEEANLIALMSEIGKGFGRFLDDFIGK